MADDREFHRAEHFVRVRQTLQSAMERVNNARSERNKLEGTNRTRRNADASPRQK